MRLPRANGSDGRSAQNTTHFLQDVIRPGVVRCRAHAAGGSGHEASPSLKRIVRRRRRVNAPAPRMPDQLESRLQLHLAIRERSATTDRWYHVAPAQRVRPRRPTDEVQARGRCASAEDHGGPPPRAMRRFAIRCTSSAGTRVPGGAGGRHRLRAQPIAASYTGPSLCAVPTPLSSESHALSSG